MNKSIQRFINQFQVINSPEPEYLMTVVFTVRDGVATYACNIDVRHMVAFTELFRLITSELFYGVPKWSVTMTPA